MPTVEPVEDAELLLAEAFVDADAFVRSAAAGFAEQLRGLDRAHVGAGQHHLGPAVFVCSRKPSPKRLRLLAAERRKRHVDVAALHVDAGEAGFGRAIAGNVAGALPMAHHPQNRGPARGHGTACRLDFAISGSTAAVRGGSGH